ncbi:glycosyltransferase [Actinomadura madurae]|nr:glycosyltransferase [Actinomadura madurae]MCQ0003405.1 glycosyltransferase [Actinomadura madurae]
MLALPSRAEGLPMSVLEAMAYGLPTVAFDCAPGVRALIEDERDGLLARPGDVPAFAAALDRLIRDPGLRRALGTEARASVMRFRPDAVLARWDRLFDLLHRELPAAGPETAPEPVPAQEAAEAPAPGRAVPRRVPAPEAEPALGGDSF